MWTTSIPAVDWQAAQVLTGLTMALWIGMGYAPALRGWLWPARWALLALYVAGAIGLSLKVLMS